MDNFFFLCWEKKTELSKFQSFVLYNCFVRSINTKNIVFFFCLWLNLIWISINFSIFISKMNKIKIFYSFLIVIFESNLRSNFIWIKIMIISNTGNISAQNKLIIDCIFPCFVDLFQMTFDTTLWLIEETTCY